MGLVLINYGNKLEKKLVKNKTSFFFSFFFDTIGKDEKGVILK